MGVSITERHCEVPKATLARTEAQMNGLTKYESRATAADVIYTEEKRSRNVEVIIHIDGAPHVTAHGEGDEFRAALSGVVGRLRRLLRDARAQRRDHTAPPLSERAPSE
ncbi:MAG: HPF/RaiA family ribosome-associated protein [Longimicrobiales bacterium]